MSGIIVVNSFLFSGCWLCLELVPKLLKLARQLHIFRRQPPARAVGCQPHFKLLVIVLPAGVVIKAFDLFHS
jgi:hypothetical protein